MAKSKCYWGGNGKHQKEYELLHSELVPAMGMAETVEGEILRAISRIYHDYFNNGFGNNWTGALNYLIKYGKIDAVELKELVPYSNNRIINCDGNKKFEEMLEGMVNKNIEYVISKKGSYEKNMCDMFSLSEPDYYEKYEDDDEWSGGPGRRKYGR